MLVGKIYRIKNLITGDIYIGSTTESLNKRHYKRLYEYRCWLSGIDRHSANVKLFESFYEYGLECFRCELISIVKVYIKSELRQIEDRYIARFGTLNCRKAEKKTQKSKKVVHRMIKCV